MPRYKASDISKILKERIEGGIWKSDDTLPNERLLAIEFGVARNTVRSALLNLEEADLISREVGRGTIVKQRTSDELRRILERVSGASPLDILNLRMIIEPQVAGSCAVHASAQDLTAIEEANTLAAQSHDLETYEKWDNAFHARIYGSTHNSFLINFFDLLAVVRYRVPIMAIRKRAFSEERRLNYCDQHNQILSALKSRNAIAASEAMRNHLATRRKNYFGE